MKKLLLILLCLPMIGFGQKTYVPNNNFENYLESNGMGDGIFGNDSVTTANINTVTYLDIQGLNVANALTGIEDFTALTYLNCWNNQLSTLDLSNNTGLTYLNCWYNNLNSLDVSNNTALNFLDCIDNQLTSLDVSNNIALTRLNCNQNQFTTLDLSNNTALTFLFCSQNQLTTLDLSNNSALASFDCNDNQLTCLNVKNQNNTNFIRFKTTDNPNLTCIEVDNVAYSTSNWVGLDFTFDSQNSFSEDCNNECSGIPPLGLNELSQPENLLSITDLLGRPSLPVPNQILLYRYSDGSVEKRIQLDR